MTRRPLCRVLPSVLGIALATTGLQVLALATPAAACACGATAPVAADPDGSVAIGEELAIISTDGSTEQIDMRLAMDTLADDAGLVVPTPAPATVSMGDLNLFAAIETQTTPKVVTTWDWWGPNPFAEDADGVGAVSGASGAAAPTVLGDVQLGPLHATTLAASDAQGLASWLDANGYRLSPQVEDLLGTYVQRDWYFVALQMTNDDTLDGELDPIRFRFDRPADGLTYPLALSQAATNRQRVDLYVFDDHKVDVDFVGYGPVDRYAGGTPLWAGPVDRPDLVSLGTYLTTYSLDFPAPASQVHGDLAFARAKNDTEVGTVVYRTQVLRFAGLPLGWFLVLVSLVVVVVTTAAVVTVAQQRRAARLPGVRQVPPW